MKAFINALIVSGIFLVSGCLSNSDGDAIQVDSSTQSVRLTNSMSYNRITLNRITLNRITLNRITLNRLADNRLLFNSLDGLEETPEGRDLLLYVARCALAQGDILVAEHEGVDYEFPGLLGVAPAWEHRGLLTHEQRLMSACLIAHVNAYGVSVPISLRSPGVVSVDGDERVDFPVYEATFFGDVFGDELETYGCIGDLPEVAMAHSPDRMLRVCSDPTDDCEVISLGRCRDVCETRTPDYGWQNCWANGTLYAETMSSYLRDHDLDGNNETCGADGRCRMSVFGHGDGILDCSEADACKAICAQGSVCTLNGTGAAAFRAVVKQRSLAEVNCHETNECVATCKSGSSCEIDCKDANECQSRVRCEGGAECLVDCTGAVECGFEECLGALQSCPGDIMVCNRECP